MRKDQVNTTVQEVVKVHIQPSRHLHHPEKIWNVCMDIFRTLVPNIYDEIFAEIIEI